MDEKIQRYNQRIQRIMFTPRKGANTSRSSRSPLSIKPTNLDKYLKYQHSSKIINNVINRKHQQLLNYFFGTIRNTQIHLKDKILKLIAVEKIQKPQRKVDSIISVKILAANLKQLYRKKYMEFINALKTFQNAAKSQAPIASLNSKLARIASQREPKKTDKQLATGNITTRSKNLTITQWDNKSAIDEQLTTKSQMQRYKEMSAKDIVKILKDKIKLNFLLGFTKIKVYNSRSAKLQQKNQQIKQIKQSSIANFSPQSNKTLQDFTKVFITSIVIYQYARACFILRNVTKKSLSTIFNKLKRYTNKSQSHKKNINIKKISLKLNKFMKIFSFKHFHLFFRQVKLINEIKKKQIQKQAMINQTKKTEISSPINQFTDIQAINPLLKIDFYSFVDKILKFMIIISKMLMPIKQAFIKIDHYASYSYHLQQSLKVLPKHFLLHSFANIKEYSNRKQVQIIPDKTNSTMVLYQYLNESIKDRLIEGFTHIKIISKERDLKIKIFPAKNNIIQSTKQFILQRDSYTSQSVQHWNGIKSLIYSSKKEKENFRTSRKKSNILP